MKLKSLFLTDNNIAINTDLYQLTMAAAYFETGVCYPATFELFVRRLPYKRSYLVAAGLEQALHYLLNIRFTEESIAYLKSQPPFLNVSEDFFDYLLNFKFTGTVHAIPEGTVFFPDEPIIQVTAPMIQAQIVETYLLTAVNYQTLIATKATRVVHAAQGRKVVDFGTRRAHGSQAGVLAARASFIGGCVGTSNVLAGYELGIPIVGTAAHSFTMTFDSEMEAFEKYHQVFPDATILLIDTYDTIEGAKRAINIGEKLKGVRLDSGDLATLSKQVRKILDDAGLHHVQIVASSDLNEYKIAEMLSQGAPIDIFGVGTELVTSKDAPALSGVYKLVEQERDGKVSYKLKLSSEKATYPGKKQVYRRTDESGNYLGDIICLKFPSQHRFSDRNKCRHTERRDDTPLIRAVIENGELCCDMPSIGEIQARTLENLSHLNGKYKRLEDADEYPVKKSDELETLRESVQKEIVQSVGVAAF